MKDILILSDNDYLLKELKELTKEEKYADYRFHWRFSHTNKAFLEKYAKDKELKPLNVKKELSSIIQNFSLVISLHCKQIFPSEMVAAVRCINVHPGFNPYNRGWFPQVFSLINGMPCGITIHEIDEDLDHGPVIYQEKVEVSSWDTSYTIYNRILLKEVETLRRILPDLLDGNYSKKQAGEGNLNLKRDFDNLCELEMSNKDTLEKHINLLRALTHGQYKNAFFYDKDGNKVFVSISLEKDEKSRG